MNRNAWAALVVAGTLLGGVAGWWIGHSSRADSSHPATTKHPPTATSSAIRSPATSAPATAASPEGEYASRIQRARNDPAYLRMLMGRYANETELDRKGALLALLGAVQNDDVLRFAIGLVASTDPAVRRDGLALLQGFPPDHPGVRDLLVRQLGAERDPQVQTKLLELLQPTSMPREDAAPIVAQLNRLARADAPEVRAASVTQLVHWDDSPATEGALLQALVDADPRVRQAAIGGVGAIHLRSDRIKDTLLDMAGDSQRTAAERHEAMLALESFPLDRTDHALLRQAANSLPAEDAHDDR